MIRISGVIMATAAWQMAIGMALPALAVQADVPWPILLGQARRVVIVTVTAVGEPEEMDYQWPGMNQPQKGWFVTYQATVKEDLRASEAEPGPGPAPKPEVLEFLAQTAAPAEPEEDDQAVLIADGPSYASLQKGDDYLLLLNRFDEQRLYLPAHYKNYGPADHPELRQIRRLASVAQWPWGKEVGGLQLAAMCQLGQQPDGAAYVEATVAVRNNGPKPVTLRVYAPDKPLAISATKDGRTVPAEYYDPDAGDFLPDFRAASNAVRVGPGQIAFIGFDGEGDYGVGFNMPLDLGTWRFQAVYRFAGSANQKDGDFWTGQLESGPFETELVRPQ
jgi:hypothetical protein